MGAAYAAYCVTCCGPYLAASGLVALSAPHGALGLMAVGLHGGAAVLPVLAAVVLPRPFLGMSRLGRRLPTLARSGAAALGAVGLWLLLSALLPPPGQG